MFENDKQRPQITLAYWVLRELLNSDGSRINVIQMVVFIEINFCGIIFVLLPNM